MLRSSRTPRSRLLGCALAFGAAPAALAVGAGCDDGLYALVGDANNGSAGSPDAMVIVDLDGDGTNELVVFRGTLIKVYDLSGAGAPVLRQATFNQLPGIFSNTNESVAADMDGDGDMDLAYTASLSTPSTPSMAFIRNDRGTLVPAASYGGAGQSPAIAAGDIDGDDVADLAVASTSPAQVRLYRGVSGGSPVLQVQLAAPAFVRGTALGDVDGDGDLDVFASCTANGGVPTFVQVFRNDGQWSFSSLATQQLSFPSKEIRAGDLNGDGRADATVLSVDEDSKCAVLLSAGANLGPPTPLVLGGSSRTHQLADLDDDGDLDVVVVVVNVAPGEVSVYFNSGSAVFSSPWKGYTSLFVRRIAIGDLDGDDWIDLVVSNTESFNTFGVARGRPVGIFALNGLVPLPAAGAEVATGDIDGDCDDDVVALSNSGVHATVHRCDGAGGFVQTQQFNASVAAPLGSPVLADVDNDGDLDLLLVRQLLSQFQVRKNDGAGFFGSAQSVAATSPVGPLRVGDLDGDGDGDVVVVSTVAPTLRLFKNDGLGGYSGAGGIAGSTAPVHALELGDLDGDGDRDAVSLESEAVRTWLNDGAGSFIAGAVPTDDPSGPGLALADLDNDGDRDIAVRLSGSQAKDLGLIFNDGAGGFAPAVVYETGSSSTRVFAQDFDGDGELDLLLGAQGGSACWIHRGLGGGVIDSPQLFNLAATGGRFGFGHFDLDGRLDLVFPPPSRFALLVGRNLLCPPSDAPAGDVNHDLVVDGCDLGLVLAAWGTSGAPSGFADVDNDGMVGGSDLGLVLANWTGDE